MFLYFAFYYLTSMRKTWRDCLGEISIQSPIYLVIATFSVLLSQKYLTLFLLQDILPHLGSETDICMSIVTENLMTCLGSQSVILRKTTVHILQIYLRFSSDVQAVIRS